MKPLSRGAAPEEYTLRVPCLLPPQFALSDPAGSCSRVEISGVQCTLGSIDGAILICASGFATKAAAREFFFLLQRTFISVAVQERIAASFPPSVVEPVVGQLSFIEGDSRCMEHGWPKREIKPLLVPKYYASVYPEHEYVAVDESIRLTPIFNYSYTTLAGKLSTWARPRLGVAELDERLLYAAHAYTHAARSTEWVWSFLLSVMALEMLADEKPTSGETQDAVKTIVAEIEKSYKGIEGVDTERLKNCIYQANTISKTRAVRNLVAKHCAPGIAAAPLRDVFADAKDCERKVGAMYDIRSKYVHEGYIQNSGDQRFPFEVLHNAALASLKHILGELLAS